jgi:hypothetical protein
MDIARHLTVMDDAVEKILIEFTHLENMRDLPDEVKPLLAAYHRYLWADEVEVKSKGNGECLSPRILHRDVMQAIITKQSP